MRVEARLVLRGDEHGGQALRRVVLVVDGDLGLPVRSQVVEQSALADVGELQTRHGGPLSLDATGGQAGDDLALEDQDKNDQRHGDDDRGRHDRPRRLLELARPGEEGEQPPSTAAGAYLLTAAPLAQLEGFVPRKACDGTGTTIPLVVSNMTAVAGRRMAEQDLSMWPLVRWYMAMGNSGVGSALLRSNALRSPS